MRGLCLALLAVLGCTDSGRVELSFDLPADDPLNPFAQPVSELTLVGRSGDDVVYGATAALDGPSATPEFPDIPIADDMLFEVTGRSPSGRVIAYGRSDTPVNIVADEVVEVTIRVRRPFTYVAGADTLAAIDATREPGQLDLQEIDVGAPVRAVAVVPGAADIVAATEEELLLVSSATHAEVGAVRVALPGLADELNVSTDGRWAVITHPEDPTGVSIVDLDALRAGAPDEPVFVPVSTPGPLAVGAGVAWVIENPLADLFCTGGSTLVGIPLDDPAAAGPAIDLNGPAAHVAADPDAARAFVALPCADRVAVVDGTDGVPIPFHLMSNPTSSTVSGGRVWMTGHVEGDDAHLVLASADPGGGDFDLLELATLEERALATMLEETGQGGLLRMTADLASAYDISVLPDGEHVAILVAAVYGTVPSGDAGGGQPIVPRVVLVTYEYQLIQLDTGLGAQRLRTHCDITWDPGALLTDFECARAPGQDETASSFIPTNLGTLYGSR